jgi:hypothetical protein
LHSTHPLQDESGTALFEADLPIVPVKSTIKHTSAKEGLRFRVNAPSEDHRVEIMRASSEVWPLKMPKGTLSRKGSRIRERALSFAMTLG